jgi:hypothetical protein
MIATNINEVKSVLTANNIELVSFDHNVIYDCYLSQCWFDDFKNEYSNQSLWFGDRQTDYIVFFASEEIKNAPFYKKSNLVKMNKQALYDLCEQYEVLNYCYSEYRYEDNTKEMLIDELMKYVDNEMYYTHHFNESNYYDLDYDFSITGYSQGDKVLIKKVGTDKQFTENGLSCVSSEYLTNLFYDTPLIANIAINVNGEEIEQLDFYYGDYVYYEKDNIINMIKSEYHNHKYFEQLLEYVEDSFPNDAKYSH